jgi:hypothetical protein
MRSIRPQSRKPRPPVRVRHDPPTLPEAVFAAQGLSDDPEHQAAIAAELMGVGLDEARAAVDAALDLARQEEAERLAAEKARVRTIQAPASRFGQAVPGASTRGVVVERRPSRNFMTVPRPSVVRLTPR